MFLKCLSDWHNRWYFSTWRLLCRFEMRHSFLAMCRVRGLVHRFLRKDIGMGVVGRRGYWFKRLWKEVCGFSVNEVRKIWNLCATCGLPQIQGDAKMLKCFKFYMLGTMRHVKMGESSGLHHRRSYLWCLIYLSKPEFYLANDTVIELFPMRGDAVDDQSSCNYIRKTDTCWWWKWDRFTGVDWSAIWMQLIWISDGCHRKGESWCNAASARHCFRSSFTIHLGQSIVHKTTVVPS